MADNRRIRDYDNWAEDLQLSTTRIAVDPAVTDPGRVASEPDKVRSMTLDAFFSAMFDASFVATTDEALSTTLQSLEVGGVATPIKVATNKVQIGGASSQVGAFGAIPAGKQLIDGVSSAPAVVNSATVPATFDATTRLILQQIVNALANLGWGDSLPPST